MIIDKIQLNQAINQIAHDYIFNSKITNLVINKPQLVESIHDFYEHNFHVYDLKTLTQAVGILVEFKLVSGFSYNLN